MSNTDILFLLIKSELFKTELDIDISNEIAEELYSLSDNYDMAHFIAEKISRYCSAELVDKFKKKQILALYRHEKSVYALGRVTQILNEAEIDFIPLKGAVISRLYPKSFQRTSCDIDILVHENDLERATAVICEKLSYKAKSERDYHDISLYSPDGVHLELHFSIKENMENLDKVLDRVWQHAHPVYKCLWEMENEFLIFHTITHMCYHFIWGGCGIRSFLDLYLMTSKLEYDETILREYLRESGIERFYDNIVSLMMVWLGNNEHTSITVKMEKYILSGGTYGNTENRIAMQQGKSGSKTGFIFTRLFLPLETLKGYYPILNKHPWLTPFMQFRRWLRLFTRKGVYKRAKDELKINSKITQEKIDKTSELLKELGL